MSIRFVWDARKAGTNARKHRVSFEEATTAFADRLGCIFDDPGHSEDEPREILVATSSQRRLLVICFTERVGSVRIISARVASPRERHAYQESH